MNDVPLRRAVLVTRLAAVFRERGYDGATVTQLSAATGLGRASLYHHFPGGKAEMAEVLVRDAISEAERLAFHHLEGSERPAARLARFVHGFGDYLENSGGTCLLGVLAVGGAREAHVSLIETQFRHWQTVLARVFEEAGQKPKRAGRAARDLLNTLYGAQMVARLGNDPRHVRRTLKRLARHVDA